LGESHFHAIHPGSARSTAVYIENCGEHGV
jgi:hypothetical protein